MDKQKFYAVRCGLIPGIYNTWDECSKNVSGYSGAEYKSFESREDAVKWLGEGDDSIPLTLSTDKCYYAVRAGEDPGIYESWEEAKKAIGYYGNDAVFKKFTSRSDAITFMKSQDSETVKKDNTGTFYAVRVGDNPGVYESWDNAKKVGIGSNECPVFKKFDNKVDAEAFMVDDNWKVTGNGSRKNFYAIKDVEHPGIYESWEEAKKNIDDWKTAKFKGFYTKEEAEEWMKETKPDTKRRKNFYAVRIGAKPGIYESWEEAKQNIGNWKRAQFKGFYTKEEAEEWMKETKPTAFDDLQSILETKPYAFVDGSYNKDTKTYGFGGFLVENGERHKIQGAGRDDDIASLWNVGGELSGAIEAIKLAIALELKEIYIIYDYLGIEMWATGKWKRNKPVTEAYYRFIQDIKELIDVHFVKVKGHTGIDGNEEADKLAKEAAGINIESQWVDEDLIELNPASDLYSYIDEIEKENKTDEEESDISSSDDSE